MMNLLSAACTTVSAAAAAAVTTALSAPAGGVPYSTKAGGHDAAAAISLRSE